MTIRGSMAAVWVALSIGSLGSLTVAAAPPEVGIHTFSDLTGRVVLDNERVLVQAFSIRPGQSTGAHRHQDAQLLVFIKGGVLKSESGRATLWKDGRVMWLEPSNRADEGSKNIGQTSIELMEVTLKHVVEDSASSKKTAYGYLSYPNIPGEDVLENDRVIVQRFVMNPGQWEGVHAHYANTFYMFIHGGQWVSKTTNPPTRIKGDSPDGDVAEMPAIDISAGHQSGNTGSRPSEVVWVALKDKP
jgi:predicted metal-dependent enzyme (double-stranded beta helix superfamily)